MLRKLFLLPFFLLPFAAAAGTADTSNASLSHVFVQKLGQSAVNVLRLRSDNTYEYVRYTKKKTNRDFGRYAMNRKSIRLESQAKKGGINPLLHKTLYVSEKGLHRSRMDAIRKRKPVITANGDDEYRKDWTYNPLIKGVSPDLVKKNPEVPKMLPGEYARKFYISTAAHYSPGYDSVLMKNYCGPDCYSTTINGVPANWAGDTSHAVLFSEFETVIHESVHGYNNRSYLVIPGVSVNVPRDKTYNSSEFAAIVPKDASSQVFRYNTYVGDKSVVSANLSGIFGLMDEYSAYLNGVRSCLLAAQKAAAEKDTIKAYSFLNMASSTSQANYEFRLFIGWYLHYAKQKYPEMYKAYLANDNLRVAFTLIDDEFKKTNLALKDFSKQIKSGTSFNTDYHNGVYTSWIAKELKKEDPLLKQFSVKGVTTENYKTYLK